RRYYVCRNILLQKEIQLDQDRKAFTEQLRSEAVSMLQWMKKDVAKRREIVEGKTPLMYDQRPTYLRAMETPMADVIRMKSN
ncbi:hypothetical protein, partial [Klebsiella pneumoniae]|uniref:hypothetical protein n=1 Tax=Klebsiella pneumoniae TaxID=573 RepID=UPI0025A2102B